MKSIRSFLGHPSTRIVIALVAFAAALSGEWNDILADLTSLQFSGHHGVLLLALWHMLDATTQLLSKTDAIIPRPN
jgi:hypothetical protein